MTYKALDKIRPGPKLDALTAEKVFGWKNIHKHEGTLVGKKQDRAGRWRLAKVPYYSTNPVYAYSIEDRMKQLGRLDRYHKELSKITQAQAGSRRIGCSRSTASGSDQRDGAVRSGYSFEQRSQTTATIETSSLL